MTPFVIVSAYLKGMRADRLLSLLLTLQTEGKVKARELARRLGVSPRTIYRDLDALTAAGIPVYAEPGPTGGVALLNDYKTQLTGLSRAELQTLFFSKPPALLQDLGVSNVFDAAQLKLLASLPAPSQEGARDARQHLYIYIDTAGWTKKKDAVPFLPLLYEAVWRGRRVSLRYARADKTVTRLVDPLGLVARGSTWYLIAGVDDEKRTYRVSRIEGLELKDAPSTRPAGFDLAAYWERSKETFRENLPRYPVTVRARPEAAERLRGSGRYVRVVAEAQEDEDGWVRLELVFEVAWEACEVLLGFGPAAEVLAPAELRREVCEQAQRIVQLYTDKR